MKILLTLVLLLVVGAATAMASPISCASVGTWGGLIAATGDPTPEDQGCLDGDKIYTVTNAGDLAPDTVLFIQEVEGALIDTHLFSITRPLGAPFGIGNYTFGYNIAVTDPLLRNIFQVAIASSQPLGGSVITVNLPDVGETLVDIGAGAGPVTFTPQPDLDVNYTIVVASTNLTNVAAVFTQQRLDSEEVIPEPATYLMLGSGLLALALLRRRRVTK